MSSLKRTCPSALAEEWIENPRPAKQIATYSRWSSPNGQHSAGDADTYECQWGASEASNIPQFVGDEKTAIYAHWVDNVNDESNDPPQWTTAQTSSLFHDGLWDRRKTLNELDGYQEGQYKAADSVLKEHFWHGLETSQCSALPAAPLSMPEAIDPATHSDYSTPKAACFTGESAPPGELCFGTVRISVTLLLLTFYHD